MSNSARQQSLWCQPHISLVPQAGLRRPQAMPSTQHKVVSHE
jgi:hypothetical protein